MTHTKTILGTMAAALLVSATACGPGVGSGEGAATEQGDWHFNCVYRETDDGEWKCAAGAHELEIIDHMGTALTSTSLANRDDAYQSDAPNNAGHLLTFRNNLAKMHRAFADNLRFHGLDPCSKNVPFIDRDAVGLCTAQPLGPKDDPVLAGTPVLDVVVPDAVEIDLDEPAAFPNGRPILVCSDTGAWAPAGGCAGEMEYVQINDLILAMGFLDLNGERECDGGECPQSLYTFTDWDDGEGLNIDHNDKELPNTFPYLASAHR